MPAPFGFLPIDANHKPIQSGTNFVTSDGTSPTPIVAPVAFTSSIFFLVPPVGAVELIVRSDVDIAITDQLLITLGNFLIPASTGMVFPVAGMDFVGFQAAGSGTLQFYFLCVKEV